MRIPEFTAEESLGRTRGQYHARLSVGSANLSSAQPQLAECFCAEPDIRKVCTRSGRCYYEHVCLQWFCPGGGGDLDNGDDGDDNGDD